MVTGVLGAVTQLEIRRILSFQIISQIGYLVLGLGLFTQLALAGAVLFMVHVILTKAALFLVSGIVNRLQGSYVLDRLGGLYASNLGVALLFLLPALSLAGLPPFSGFWAKFALLKAGLEVGQYAIVAVALVVSLLTLFSMTKIWAAAFWKPRPDGPTVALVGRERLWLFVPTVLLVALTVGLGLLAQPAMELALTASQQLFEPGLYIATVLGGGG